MNRKQAIQIKDLVKPCNDVLEQLGWKWEPKVGEWFLDKQGNPRLMIGFNGEHIKDPDNLIHYPPEVTPILHWEELERVLEGAGYYMIVSHQLECPTGVKHGYDCTLWHRSWSKDKEIDYIGKSRQEAVMKAVIELRKEGEVGNE